MPGECDCHLPPGGPLSPLYDDAQEGDSATNAYTPWDIDFTSAAAAAAAATSLPSTRQPEFGWFPASDQLFEGASDPLNIQQPPPDVINYWFDRLGLSLDPTSSQNPSNSTNFLIRSLPVDGVNDVSLFYVV